MAAAAVDDGKKDVHTTQDAWSQEMIALVRQLVKEKEENEDAINRILAELKAACDKVQKFVDSTKRDTLNVEDWYYCKTKAVLYGNARQICSAPDSKTRDVWIDNFFDAFRKAQRRDAHHNEQDARRAAIKEAGYCCSSCFYQSRRSRCRKARVPEPPAPNSLKQKRIDAHEDALEFSDEIKAARKLRHKEARAARRMLAN
jgi:hypothetical protein